MKKYFFWLIGLVLMVSSSVYLVACHSNSGNNWIFGAGATNGSSTFSKGVITGKGSIIVNGVEFDTNNAIITVNGSSGVQNDLKAGQVVTLRGTSSDSSGTASHVDFSDNLTGPISSITTGTTGTTVTVLGQTIIIDNKTVLTSSGTGTVSLASLGTGSVIEVSGLPDNTGTIHATFIESKPTGTGDYDIRGVVSLFTGTTGTTGSTFTLTPPRSGNTLLVTLATGSLPSGLANGQTVDVKIDPATYPSPFTSTSITAKSVILGTGLVPAENDVVFVEGFVSNPTGTTAGANTFEIDGTTVDAGSFAVPPAGTLVIVHGTFSGGIIKADRPIVLAGISNFFIGPLASVGTSTISFGTGTNPTDIFDIGTAKIKVNGAPGTLNELEAGKQVIVQSAVTLSTGTTGTNVVSTGTGTASLVWIVDNLTGPISATSGTLFISGVTGTSSGTLTMLGQNIKIDGNTRFGHNLTSSATGSVVSFATGSSVVNVSGVPDGSGHILATFIDSKPTATQYHVLGLVSDVTGTPVASFKLTPDTGAPSLDVLATGVTTTVSNGQLVDVKINPATVIDPASTSITAESVDIVNQPKPADGDQVTVEGVVSNLSGNTFTVNGINVDGSTATTGIPAGLANGSKVRVRGVMSGGTLIAGEIEIIS